MSTFADLQKTIKALAKVPSQVASGAADVIDGLIQDQFDAGVNPYGEGWDPLEEATLLKGRTPPPLTDTTDMRDGITVRPMPGTGIAITLPDPAVHHQYGTVHMAQRAIYPNAGMPDTWRRAIADAADDAWDRAAGGLRK